MHERFGTEAKDVIAAVGPSICQECYEVSGDVIEEFRAAFPETLHEKLFCGKPDGKYQLNLGGESSDPSCGRSAGEADSSAEPLHLLQPGFPVFPPCIEGKKRKPRGIPFPGLKTE